MKPHSRKFLLNSRLLYPAYPRKEHEKNQNSAYRSRLSRPFCFHSEWQVMPIASPHGQNAGHVKKGYVWPNPFRTPADGHHVSGKRPLTIINTSFPQRFWAGIQVFLKENWIPDKGVRGWREKPCNFNKESPPLHYCFCYIRPPSPRGTPKHENKGGVIS